jgi:hypothetical protein
MAKAETPSVQTPRAWQRMLSGRRLDLLNPQPDDIAIEDIAHGLARVARWNGQTLGDHAFSVAQHALLVVDIAAALKPGCERRWLLATLLHDAPEYVIGDLISPFKAAVGLDYRAFEKRLLRAIHLAFGLPEELPEPTVLAGFSLEEAARYFGEAEDLPPRLVRQLRGLAPQPAAAAQAAFLARFQALAGG